MHRFVKDLSYYNIALLKKKKEFFVICPSSQSQMSCYVKNIFKSSLEKKVNVKGTWIFNFQSVKYNIYCVRYKLKFLTSGIFWAGGHFLHIFTLLVIAEIGFYSPEIKFFLL